MTEVCQGRGGRDGIVDIHAHFLPARYRGALAEAGLVRLDGGMPIPDWSVGSALDVMDRHGIAAAVLSVSSPGLTFLAPSRQAALARAVNEDGAALAAAGDGRFGAFATLPVGDPAAAVAEIDHVFDTLGLDGVVLETNHAGCYPGAPEMVPILAALNARRAIVFLHPTSPPCFDCLGGGRPAPLIEFPFDTTRAVVDLIYSGAMARFPEIRFVVAHAGGTLPFLAQRIAGFTLAAPALANGLAPADVLAQLGRLFYDTALSATPAQIAALREIAPVSQILFGSDWPFSPEPLLGGGIAALRTLEALTPEDRRTILGENARRLLAVAPR